MNKRRIILGLTGSVASVLYQKLVKELNTIGDTITILTPKAEHFVSDGFDGIKVMRERKEWEWFHPNAEKNENPVWNKDDFYSNKWEKNDPVLHINLRDNASALVIAPCSANTLAKLANGICDNLLLSVARAWDFNRPFIVAPAMNTHMWSHPTTQEHIAKLRSWGVIIINPQSKMLACNTEGMGALADISEIVKATQHSLRWRFPLADLNQRIWGGSDIMCSNCSGIPVEGHPGAYKTIRKHHTHTGVDLYTNDGQRVYAVESGTVVGIEDFTGSKQQSPWWEDTQCILIEGASGVVCYGEINPSQFLKVGSNVKAGHYIGEVKRVLKLGKERPDIQGHSTSMLHIEMYKHGIKRAFEEVGDNKSDWRDLKDPTQLLIESEYSPKELLKPTLTSNCGDSCACKEPLK